MSHPKISCILITREEFYPEILLDRLDLDFFDEILIMANCPSVYERYLSAKRASNDIIYVQDDDCMVNYQELFKHYNGQITNTMPLSFQDKYKDLGCTLVGWGCYFPASMLSSLDKYIIAYGVDDHLLREADRIFTFLNQPFNTVTMPHEDLPQAPDRMGVQENHYKSMNEALEKVRNLK